MDWPPEFQKNWHHETFWSNNASPTLEKILTFPSFNLNLCVIASPREEIQWKQLWTFFLLNGHIWPISLVFSDILAVKKNRSHLWKYIYRHPAFIPCIINQENFLKSMKDRTSTISNDIGIVWTSFIVYCHNFYLVDLSICPTQIWALRMQFFGFQTVLSDLRKFWMGSVSEQV